jgi:16S rRNA (adenine1518-N6/adenine1519-N6)-dimethyltransferase
MITPKKSLGQHFLRDENVARKIVRELRLAAEDVVVEIGPGTGALTKYLVTSARNVVGIEVDRRAAEVLREFFSGSIEIIESDVLRVDLTAVAATYRQLLRVVGNIPYNITSEILFWLFEHHSAVRDATLMMQVEVAQRLLAKPKTKAYGILSVVTHLYAQPALVFTVSRNSFYPVPEVDSALVHLDFRRQLPPCNVPLLLAVVRATFGKRRKTLRNGLRYMGWTDEQLEAVRFDLQRRPEELSLEEFIELTSQLERFQKSLAASFPS